MSCTWIKTIVNLRKYGHLSYSIKHYHDKVLRLKGGKPPNYTEKEAKFCLTKEMKTAVADSKRFMRIVEKIAGSKYKYETDDARSFELWLKAGVALGIGGKDSPKYAAAMKSYVESLRLIDVWLGYDIDEIEAFMPVGLKLINDVEAETRYGKALEKHFKACSKEPSLSKWKPQFSALSQDCAIYTQSTQKIAKDLLAIIAECQKQLKLIKAKKKLNLEWYKASKKNPPQDIKTMEKNNKATKPSF